MKKKKTISIFLKKEVVASVNYINGGNAPNSNECTTNPPSQQSTIDPRSDSIDFSR